MVPNSTGTGLATTFATETGTAGVCDDWPAAATSEAVC